MRAMRTLCLLLLMASVGPWCFAQAQAAPGDPEVEKGIRYVDEGNFEEGVKILDRAAQRLKTSGGQPRQLSMAYLYLAIAHLQLSQEQAARAKFVEAVRTDQNLKLSEYEFPPKVIRAFEDARKEVIPPSSPSPAKPKVAPSTFIAAVKQGDFATVRQLVTDDPTLLSAKDEAFGATPLHWAALKGNQAIAALLVARGADLAATNRSGETPAQVAERANHPEVAGILRPSSAGTPTGTVFDAVKAGDVAQVRQWLATNPSLLNVKDTAFGATPLHWAVLKGHDPVVSLLLDLGADTTVRNNAGETPLQVAERAKRREIAARLRGSPSPAPSGISELIDAIRAGSLERARGLISANPDLVKAKDSQYGATALHWAALRGQVEIVRLLMAQGADPEAKNNEGETPLQVAQRAGKGPVVDVLKR